MTSETSPLALRLGAAAGFIAMALLGWSLTSDKLQPSDAAAAEPVETRTARAARPSRLTGPGAVAASRIAFIRAVGSPEARLRATIDLASALPPSEFAAWLDGGWFTLRGGAELTLFTKILQERWALEDPEGLLVWSLNNKAGNPGGMLSSLAGKDPQRVIDFFRNRADGAGSMRALQGLAGAHSDLALQCLREIAGYPISTDDSLYVSGLLKTLAEKSSAALEAALDSLPLAMRNQAEMELCGQRLKTSFATEIRALWDRPDGLKIFLHQGSETGSRIFDELAHLPPAWRAALADNPYSFITTASAEKWLAADLSGAGFSAAQQKQIREKALAELADTNPELALRTMVGMEMESQQRMSILSNAISSAQGNADRIEAVIAMMETEADRTAARGLAANYSAGSDAKKIETPAEWLADIAGASLEQGTVYRYFSLVGNWDLKKNSALSAQFGNLPAEEKQKVAQAIVRSSQSDNFADNSITGTAIRHLLENPGAQGENAVPVHAASYYAVAMVVRDPVAASEWVATLPPGEARLWARKNVANNWRQYDPKAADQWLKTLPHAEREAMEKLK